MQEPTTKAGSTIVKDLVSTLGFPIVVAGWLLYERWTMLQDYQETLVKLTNTINQNTTVVQELIRTVGGQ